MKTRQGFILIEFMIVVAVIAILFAIAITAYQSYTIRPKVSEILVLASDAKLAVIEILGCFISDSVASYRGTWF